MCKKFDEKEESLKHEGTKKLHSLVYSLFIFCKTGRKSGLDSELLKDNSQGLLLILLTHISS